MISQMANRHGKIIEPMLCLTVDFYVRLFIRVKNSAIGCHRSILKYSQVYQCQDCESFWLQPMGREQVQKSKKDGAQKKYKKQDKEAEDKDQIIECIKNEPTIETKIAAAKITVPFVCATCDANLIIGGPIWNQKMHEVEFCKRLQKVVKS